MSWKFLTNHARVLTCIAQDPSTRLRDIAVFADITERAAHRIVCELEAGGYLTRRRVGARNVYEVHPERPLHDRLGPDLVVGDLLRLLLDQPEHGGAAASDRQAEVDSGERPATLPDARRMG